MGRLLIALVCAPSIFEFCIIVYAAQRTQQFFLLWGLLLLFTLAKFSLKYVHLLRRPKHKKRD